MPTTLVVGAVTYFESGILELTEYLTESKFAIFFETFQGFFSLGFCTVVNYHRLKPVVSALWYYE